MSNKKALYVGGCTAPYHQLEPTLDPILSALGEIGVATDAGGVYHPDNAETPVGDYRLLNRDNLKQYDALVLFTTGNSQGEDVDAILEFVREGKALIGLHCAADSFQNRPDFVAALGGLFRHHPEPLDIKVDFIDADHPVTEGLESFTVHDELYFFKDYDPARVHLLAQTTSQDDNGPIPICWVRKEGKGRVFYLSLGHFPQVMHDPHWRTLFQRGVEWALAGTGQ